MSDRKLKNEEHNTESMQHIVYHVPNTENRKYNVIHSIRKADFVLIVTCLLFAVFLGIFFVVQRRTGSVMTLSHNGTEIYRLDINEFKHSRKVQYYLVLYREQEIHIMHFEEYPALPEEEMYNLLSVEDGKVTMEAADCRDQICVHHIPITSHRESIICLPHKLVVELTGSTEDEPLDGVAG